MKQLLFLHKREGPLLKKSEGHCRNLRVNTIPLQEHRDYVQKTGKKQIFGFQL